MAPESSRRDVQSAEVVLPCAELDETLRFFTDELGFRVDAVHPAEGPRVVVVSGHGVRLRLDRDADAAPGRLRLACAGGPAPATLTAPNGTQVELVAADAGIDLPPLAPSLSIARLANAEWTAGRVGMRYRDLLPDKQGGRFTASHIKIPGGGEVSDYVHYHLVRFQLIHCAAGRVRVVYEDQGGPFWLEAGQCVLQPPGIRHRVLEASPGLEVVELSSPAGHATLADHELELPNGAGDPGRDYGGQRFVRRHEEVEAATGGLARVGVTRPVAGELEPHGGELLFRYVLAGGLTLEGGGRAERLVHGDALAVPGALGYGWADVDPGTELLEVAFAGPAARSA